MIEHLLNCGNDGTNSKRISCSKRSVIVPLSYMHPPQVADNVLVNGRLYICCGVHVLLKRNERKKKCYV